MTDATFLLLAAVLAAGSDPHDGPPSRAVWPKVRTAAVAEPRAVAEPDAAWRWRPSASLEEVVIRAQSADSPFFDDGGYQDLPPAGQLPQYPFTPDGTTAPGGVPYSPPGGYEPLPYTPYPTSPTPYDPFLGSPPPGIPTGPTGYPSAPSNGIAGGEFSTYGVTGPQPFRFGPSPRLDADYITPSHASGRRGAVSVFELNLAVPVARQVGNSGNVFTYTPQFNLRDFNGPDTGRGVLPFPNDLYRFGLDLEYQITNPGGPVGFEFGFTPSIATDFQQSLSRNAFLFDGRAAALFRANDRTTVVLGAFYWDRVRDLILPYAGVIYRPDDRLELRLVFPNPRITYFAGHMLGKPTWVYTGLDYNVEAYQTEGPLGSRNQLEIRDYRFLVGAKKDQGWGGTFLEAGYVFGRRVRYASGPYDFNVGDGFMFRGGIRF